MTQTVDNFQNNVNFAEVLLHLYLSSALDGGEGVFNLTFQPVFPPNPLDMRLAGTKSLSGSGGKEEKSLPLQRIKPRSCGL
jgi:hypothetical protein